MARMCFNVDGELVAVRGAAADAVPATERDILRLLVTWSPSVPPSWRLEPCSALDIRLCIRCIKPLGLLNNPFLPLLQASQWPGPGQTSVQAGGRCPGQRVHSPGDVPAGQKRPASPASVCVPPPGSHPCLRAAGPKRGPNRSCRRHARGEMRVLSCKLGCWLLRSCTVISCGICRLPGPCAL